MDFAVYKKFVDEEPAIALIEELRSNNIAAELTQGRESLDSLYGQKIFAKEFFVKIKLSDFSKANALLEKQSKEMLASVDKDHYLFSFTDTELIEILDKPDEWSEFDVELAKNILRERGREINEEKAALKKFERFQSLAEPLVPQPLWIYIGYFFAVGGGVLGLIMGWHISTHKKPLPNGQMTYAFTAGDRWHGKIIMILGIAVLAISIGYKVLNME